MTDNTQTTRQTGPEIPADDPNRMLAVVRPDDPRLRHYAVVGDTYPSSFPAPRPAGATAWLTCWCPMAAVRRRTGTTSKRCSRCSKGRSSSPSRGKSLAAAAGTTVNIPSNAPHAFRNKSGKPARLLCMCTPAGQDEFFMAVGVPVESRTTPAPKLSREEQEAFLQKVVALAPKYRTELLGP